MYRPAKKDPEPAREQRVKLPLLPVMPTVKQIRGLVEESKIRVGTIVEQTWSTDRPGVTFNIMVQWDKGQEYPVWTLYEENGQDSKMCWSQPFHPSEVDMLYDIMAMSVESGGQPSAKIPDSLKPSDSPPAAASPAEKQSGGGGLAGSLLGGRGSAPAPAPVQAPKHEEPAPVYSAPSAAAAPQPAPFSQGNANQYPPAQPNQYPPQPPYQPAAQAPYPQQAYQAPPQQGYPAPPQYPPPYPQQGQPFPPQQNPYPPQAPQPGYGYGGFPQQQQQGYPPQQYPSTAPDANSPWSTRQNMEAAAGKTLPPELSPIKGGVPLDRPRQGTNILLGTLLFESGLINKPTLDAALKIQDMVREGKVSTADAPEQLKRLHDMGGSIEQYMTKSDGKPANASAAAGTPNAERTQEQRAALDLLMKAGLLKEDDLKSASQVRSKHGGDMVQILGAAGKLEQTIYAAAATCVPLIRDNKMKVEQCIIALNYCSRSRVDFSTALDELNWPNPLKQ